MFYFLFVRTNLEHVWEFLKSPRKCKFLVVVLITCLISCLDSPKKHETKSIILSKASANYIDWIEDDNIVIIDAYRTKNTDSILLLADGIILTGGEDINPLEYNDTNKIKVCGPIDIEEIHWKENCLIIH